MLRLARKADAPIVHALFWAAKGEIPLDDNFADAEHQKWVHDQCKSRAVWVHDEGAIAGAMIMKPNEICYLVVTAERRHTGIGKALISHAKQRAKTSLKARVKPYNTKMIRLLMSEGF